MHAYVTKASFVRFSFPVCLLSAIKQYLSDTFGNEPDGEEDLGNGIYSICFDTEDDDMREEQKDLFEKGYPLIVKVQNDDEVEVCHAYQLYSNGELDRNIVHDRDEYVHYSKIEEWIASGTPVKFLNELKDFVAQRNFTEEDTQVAKRLLLEELVNG